MYNVNFWPNNVPFFNLNDYLMTNFVSGNTEYDPLGKGLLALEEYEKDPDHHNIPVKLRMESKSST